MIKVKKLSVFVVILLFVAVLLSACNSGVEVTIYFDSNGGSDVAPVTTKGNATISIPQNPTKDGQEFKGWFWDNETFSKPFTANSLADAPIQSDMTVYAKWEPVGGETPEPTTYTITFNTNGGGSIAPITIEAGATITIPNAPTREGYTFDGWYTDNNNFVNEYIISTTPAESITLYAKWIEGTNSPTTYTISFNANDGTTVASIIAEAGSTIFEPTEPIREGYEFAGWYTDDGTFLNEYIFSTMTAGSKTLHAKWIKEYTITFDTNIESNVGSITKTAEATLPTLPVPTRLGYAFEGWYIDNNTFNNLFSFTVMPANDITLYAKWSRLYTISFESNEGSFVNSILKKPGEAIVAPKDPIMSGYAFEGWYIDNNTFNNLFSFTVMPANDITLYAKWSRLYTISFESNEGSFVNSILKKPGEAIVAPKDPIMSGYTFEGWYSDDDTFLNVYNFGIMPSQNIILYAKWNLIQGTEGLNYILIKNNTEYEVASIGAATDNAIIIPAAYLNKPVTSIRENSFLGCSGITSIIIPDSVTSIGKGAFYSCRSLVSITIPFVGATKSGSSDTHFGYIFGATSYSESRVPSSLRTVIITGGTRIYSSAFSGCSSITSITIPTSIGNIGSSAFSGCSKLVSVCLNGVIPPTLSTDVFVNNASIRKFYVPAESLNTYKTASRWNGLTNAIYSQDIIDARGFAIIDNVLTRYLGSETEIAIPASVTSIGYGAFWYCSEITSITIPISVTTISDSAFYSCAKLTSITIPDSVTSLGWNVFFGCRELTSVTIGSGVSSIGNYAFDDCDELRSILIYAITPPEFAHPFVNNFNTNGGKIYVPQVSLYKNASVWKNYSNNIFALSIIDDDNFAISYGTLIQYIGTNTAITIPDNVKNIGEYAFYNSSSLISISFSENSQLVSIRSHAFSGCKSLLSITIPDRVTIIEDSTFLGCISLTSFTISDSVTIIGSNAFKDCSNLIRINSNIDGIYNIPNSVTNIGKSVFNGCSGITSLVLPFVGASINGTSNTHFGYIFGARDASYNSGYVPIGLKSVVITGGESISDNAFSGCSGITSITIPDGVTSIGSSAFRGCSNLVSIALPFVGGSIKTALDTNQYQFGYIFGTSSYTGGTETRQWYNESSTSSAIYTTYYIPASLKSVTITGGNILFGAFSYCNGLTSVTIGDSITSIGEWAFRECSGLTSITIGEGVTSIGDLAFYGCSGLTSITIPDNVTSIGEDWPFPYCNSLTSIIVDEGNMLYHSNGNCLIKTASKTLIAGCKNSIIPTDNSVTSIGNYAFRDCWGLTSITIPDSVTSIANSAFFGCHKLIQITNLSGQSMSGLPSNVGQEIRTSLSTPFINVLSTDSDGLITYTVGSIKYAIDYTGIESSIDFTGKGITALYKFAFYGCTVLTSILIPDSVTSIERAAFYNCSNLSSVTFEITSGWYSTYYSTATGGANIIVTNASTNATNLKSATCINDYWKRNT